MMNVTNSLRLARCMLLGIILGFPCVVAFASDYSETCPNGAPVREARYCRFFAQFNANNSSPLDIRIADALGVKDASETRSIGLIIAIDKYPNLPGLDIPAAAVDRKRLVDFLINKQKFDEVIVLSNEDASVDNINYFLDDYLYKRAYDFNKKARLLIAYSGHGRYGDADSMANASAVDARAAFILSAANDPDGWENVYKMQEFAGRIENLAGRYFHVLTLVNACYGGNFFITARGGGNPDSFTKSGSYAITAGSSDDRVPALDPRRGSLFFDLLIEGIMQGSADPLYWDAYRTVADDGKTSMVHGLTRTGALASFLTSSYARIILGRRAEDKKFTLSDPWVGPAQAGIAWGGFFFLSDRSSIPLSPLAIADYYKDLPSQQTGVITFGAAQGATISAASARIPANETAQIAVPAGPVSSIAGRPDIKIFKAPDIYPVKGYDLSSSDGKINWEALADSERPRFIYARAIGWAGLDTTFNERWSHIKNLGIDYGAYLKYDFCRSPKAQIARLSAIVPVDQEALPLAIEIVNPQGESNSQLACFNSLGIENAKQGILELASAVRTHYGKTPLLYGNRNNLSKFLDQRSEEFMIWLGSWGSTGTQLSGRNPWTLWQYSGTLSVKGVGSKTTGNVFFGTEEQYDLFKKGQINVALKAVK